MYAIFNPVVQDTLPSMGLGDLYEYSQAMDEYKFIFNKKSETSILCACDLRCHTFTL